VPAVAARAGGRPRGPLELPGARARRRVAARGRRSAGALRPRGGARRTAFVTLGGGRSIAVRRRGARERGLVAHARQVALGVVERDERTHVGGLPAHLLALLQADPGKWIGPRLRAFGDAGARFERAAIRHAGEAAPALVGAEAMFTFTQATRAARGEQHRQRRGGPGSRARLRRHGSIALYSTLTTSSSRSPLGRRSVTTSPTTLPSSARAIGEWIEIRPRSTSASCSPTMT